MSKRNNNGIFRRPLEVALIIIAVAMVAVLMWANYALKNTDTGSPQILRTNLMIDSEPTGKLDEIFKSLEEEFGQIETESNFINLNKYHVFMGEADSVGSIYDETAYTSADNVCSQVAGWFDDVQARFSEKTTRLSQLRAEYSSDADGDLTKTKKSVDELRAKYSAYRQKVFALIGDQSDSEDVKARLEALLEERDTALDASMQNLLNGRRAVLDSLADQTAAEFEAFKVRARQAFETAQASCRRGLDDNDVKRELVSSLSSARVAYGDFRRGNYTALGDGYLDEFNKWSERVQLNRQIFESRLREIRP